jgi:hypothetical protein
MMTRFERGPKNTIRNIAVPQHRAELLQNRNIYVLKVVDEQEMLCMCRFMVRADVYVLRISIELWEEMKKGISLNLNSRQCAL